MRVYAVLSVKFCLMLFFDYNQIVYTERFTEKMVNCNLTD